MKPVLDRNGFVIPGLLKKDDGSLVVNDEMAYKKNKAAKDTMIKMRSDIDRLTSLVESLLEQKN